MIPPLEDGNIVLYSGVAGTRAGRMLFWREKGATRALGRSPPCLAKFQNGRQALVKYLVLQLENTREIPVYSSFEDG